MEAVVASTSVEAALRTADLLQKAAGIVRRQAELTRERAELSRAIAESEREEGKLDLDAIRAIPRFRRVKLLEGEARVLLREAEVLDTEGERLLAQSRTAELRARLGLQAARDALSTEPAPPTSESPS
jgi:hypothetical protein